MREKLQSTIKEISRCSTKQFIVVVAAAVTGVLWPLGGLLLFLISRRTKFKLYGKIAIYCAAAAMLAYLFKLIVTVILL